MICAIPSDKKSPRHWSFFHQYDSVTEVYFFSNNTTIVQKFEKMQDRRSSRWHMYTVIQPLSLQFWEYSQRCKTPSFMFANPRTQWWKRKGVTVVEIAPVWWCMNAKTQRIHNNAIICLGFSFGRQTNTGVEHLSNFVLQLERICICETFAFVK